MEEKYVTKSELKIEVENIVNKAVVDLCKVINDMGQRIHEELVPMKVDIKELKADVKNLKHDMRDVKKSLIHSYAVEERILDVLIDDKQVYTALTKRP